MNKYYCICRDWEDGSRRYLNSLGTMFTNNIKSAYVFDSPNCNNIELEKNEYVIEFEIIERKL